MAKQQKEPLLSSDIPSAPWSIVAQDLFTLAGKSYLITVDYYSDFWELDAVSDTSCETIVELTKGHFARYGIPQKVITDNGPQFRAQLYEDFAKQWGFDHLTSSPYHSQSNGKAESAVKIAKGMLKKVTKDNRDISLAILSWRNTPTAGGHYSPVQKLHSWSTRTRLPTANKLLKPRVASGVVDEIKQRRQQAKIQYDKSAKELPALVIGQTVRIQPIRHMKEWKKATVIKKVSTRSYIVRAANGQTYRRNRKHLRPTEEIPLNDITTTDKAAEDKLTIPEHASMTETQQANEPEMVELEQGSSQTQHSDHAVSRAGRVLKPPTRLRDYIKH